MEGCKPLVVGTHREDDIAVLRIAGGAQGSGSGSGGALPALRAMPVGTSVDLSVGQSCYAVGAGETAGGGGRNRGAGGSAALQQQLTMVGRCGLTLSSPPCKGRE